jgi:hypothetical protein
MQGMFTYLLFEKNMEFLPEIEIDEYRLNCIQKITFIREKKQDKKMPQNFFKNTDVIF